MKANDVNKVLTRCRFNPNADVKSRIMADVGNPKYYVSRAIQELRLLEAGEDISIIDVIRILAMAEHYESTGTTDTI